MWLADALRLAGAKAWFTGCSKVASTAGEGAAGGGRGHGRRD